MKINWRDPLKETPKDKQKIWYLEYHWKVQIPGSFRIKGGEFRVSPNGEMEVANIDDFGQGCEYFPWALHYYDCNLVGAWVPMDEINLPKWLFEEKK